MIRPYRSAQAPPLGQHIGNVGHMALDSIAGLHSYLQHLGSAKRAFRHVAVSKKMGALIKASRAPAKRGWR